MQAEEIQNFLSKGKIIVRMRGLPYGCTGEQILQFFSNSSHNCEVVDGKDGILFIRRADGRLTGDAFVQFDNETQVSKALAKHKQLIGMRYIELFTSTPTEVQQVIRKATVDKAKTPIPTLPSAPPTGASHLPLSVVPLLPLPQHLITSGTRRDCLRLRGLPYEAQVEHILNFLGDFASNIVLQGVHMVYNEQGHPSGEAFIQMDSEASATGAAIYCHHRHITLGKKEYVVEVFQCSGEDMKQLLMGGSGLLGHPNQLIQHKSISGTELAYLPYYDPYLLNHIALQHHMFVKKPYYSVPPPPPPFLSDAADAKAKPGDQDLLPYFMPRLLPSLSPVNPGPPVLSKPGYPMIVAPPLHSMGVLGVKRSWDQAFPLETPQAQKRWQTTSVSGYPSTSYYPEA